MIYHVTTTSAISYKTLPLLKTFQTQNNFKGVDIDVMGGGIPMGSLANDGSIPRLRFYEASRNCREPCFAGFGLAAARSALERTTQPS